MDNRMFIGESSLVSGMLKKISSLEREVDYYKSQYELTRDALTLKEIELKAYESQDRKKLERIREVLNG